MYAMLGSILEHCGCSDVNNSSGFINVLYNHWRLEHVLGKAQHTCVFDKFKRIIIICIFIDEIKQENDLGEFKQ